MVQEGEPEGEGHPAKYPSFIVGGYPLCAFYILNQRNAPEVHCSFEFLILRGAIVNRTKYC